MMKYVKNLIALLVSTCVLSQEKDTMNLMTYTLGNFVSENAHKIVAENWPFSVNAVAGDLIDEYIVREIECNNNQLWESLSASGLNNPEATYLEEVRVEEVNIQKALNLLEISPEIKVVNKKIREQKRSSWTLLTKISNTEYQFEIFSFKISEMEVREKFEIALIVDIRTCEISVVNP